MGLEAGDGYISGLVATNPVGATDPKSQGDDHIRLIKAALLGTFPNLNGAVTAAPAELNILDGATLSTAELNILDGVTLTASQINDAARKSVANAFTNSPQQVTADEAQWRAVTAGGITTLLWASAGDGKGYVGTNSAHAFSILYNGAPAATFAGTTLSNITLGGVTASDFARLSQGGTFVGDVTLSHNSNPTLQLTDADNSVGAYLRASGSGNIQVGSSTSHPVLFVTNGTSRGTLSSGGNWDFGNGTVTVGGAITAATIATSSSTTLVAGQVHFISGTATLPNLTAGQWVQVVNDSGSPITINVNGSDTTSWTLTGATISTSFTLGSRGVLTAICSPSGSNVYVSGSGITAAS